jgi:hypothetical protein
VWNAEARALDRMNPAGAGSRGSSNRDPFVKARLPLLIITLLAAGSLAPAIAAAPDGPGQATTGTKAAGPVPAKARPAGKAATGSRDLPRTGQAPARAGAGTGRSVAARPLPAPGQAGEDQSFLYSDYRKAPPSSAGPPDYVTNGSSHFNQPWFMSIYDKLGNWPP